MEPVIARYQGAVKRLYFRGDAAFANPEIYEFHAPVSGKQTAARQRRRVRDHDEGLVNDALAMTFALSEYRACCR
jgi:hypothetical protein